MGYFGSIRLFYVSLKKLSLPDMQITRNYFWWFGKEPQPPDPGEEIFRRSRSQMLLKIFVLKNFGLVTGKEFSFIDRNVYFTSNKSSIWNLNFIEIRS